MGLNYKVQVRGEEKKETKAQLIVGTSIKEINKIAKYLKSFR
jgi:hypothetical protein